MLWERWKGWIFPPDKSIANLTYTGATGKCIWHMIYTDAML